LEVEGVRQRCRSKKRWKELVNKGTNELHIKPSEAVYHSKWRKMVRYLDLKDTLNEFIVSYTTGDLVISLLTATKGWVN